MYFSGIETVIYNRALSRGTSSHLQTNQEFLARLYNSRGKLAWKRAKWGTLRKPNESSQIKVGNDLWLISELFASMAIAAFDYAHTLGPNWPFSWGNFGSDCLKFMNSENIRQNRPETHTRGFSRSLIMNLMSDFQSHPPTSPMAPASPDVQGTTLWK